MSGFNIPNVGVAGSRARRMAMFGAVFVLILLPAIAFLQPKAKVGEVTVYLPPECGCCRLYVEYLKRQGFEVRVVETEDIAEVKNRFGIPYLLQSCHTSVIGGYFVEGHVPAEAIRKLLDERPDVDGIILPGMPPGSPGMPGVKEESFEIYALKDGNLQVFAVL